MRKLYYSSNNKSFNLALQLVIAIILVAMIAVFATNLHHILVNNNITTGFHFLQRNANINLSFHLIQFNQASSYTDAFIVGILNTLLVSGLSIVFATLLGIFLSFMSLSRNWILSSIARTYIELMRNIPLLLQIFFWYYAVLRTMPRFADSIVLWDVIFLNNRGLHYPKALLVTESNVLLYSLLAIIPLWILTNYIVKKYYCYNKLQSTKKILSRTLHITWGIIACTGIYLLLLNIEWTSPYIGKFNLTGGWCLTPEITALVVSLSMYTAAYIAEIIRGGIENVDKGQTEAAYSLGISRHSTLYNIIIPQSMSLIIPSITSQYLSLIKNSSLGAAIAFPELVAIFSGTVANQTGQHIETIIMAMGVYLTISICISCLMNWYNFKCRLIS